MKKNVIRIATVVLLLHSTCTFAQKAKSVFIDAKVGLNSIWILNQNAYGNPEMNYATSIGLTESVGVTYFVDELWGLSTSFGMIKLGQNYGGDQAQGDADRKVKLMYYEVPVLVMRKLPRMDTPTWLSFGPEILLLSKASQKYTRSGGVPLPNNDGMMAGDVKERYKPMDVALRFGVNQMFKLHFGEFDKMALLMTYNTAIGITDINSTDFQTPNQHGDYGASRNFYIGIRLGLLFNASKN